MLFCVKTPINKLYAFGTALLLAAALAGCGGGGGTTTTPVEPPVTPEPTPQEQCEAAGGRWNADNTCTSAEDIEKERMAEVAAKTKAAGTKETAIEAEATQTNDAGLGGSVPSDNNDGVAVATYSLSIERDSDGTTVTITDTALNDDDDPKFAQVRDLGGGRTMHARVMEADDDGNVMREIVVVNTDIDPPVPTAFGEVHTLDIRVDGEAATEDDPNDALQIAAGDVGMVKANAFEAPAGSIGTTVLSFQQAVEAEDTEGAEIAGTFDGAAGTYKCNRTGADACTVTVNAEGVVSAVSGDNHWIFIPAAGAEVDVASTDYLWYGFWLKNTTDKDGVLTYNEVETFAGASVDASGDTNAVGGRATYEGGAVGVYVKNVYKTDGTLDTATSGDFTADVELQATFGQVSNDDGEGTIAESELNTVTGTIDNFTLSGGEENDWEVTLQGDITADAGTAAGTAQGEAGGESGDGPGSFSGTFHGDVTADADTNVVPKPGSVVGEFNSMFSNGSVAGAFGARLKTMEE